MKCFHCGEPYKLEDEICKRCGTEPTGAELELLYCNAKVKELEELLRSKEAELDGLYRQLAYSG